jgi:hypothetical protein
MRVSVLSVLAAVALATACASNAVSTTASPSQRTSTSRRTNVISMEELAQDKSSQSAADVVRKLRPAWVSQAQALQRQGRPLQVWIDTNVFGDFSSLSQITATRVKEIHWLTKSEAQSKWGSRVQEVVWVVSK